MIAHLTLDKHWTNCNPPKNGLSDKSEERDTLPEPEVNQRKCANEGNLLIPLNSQCCKMGIPSTPNLVLKMNQRKEEREKGREVLRQIYEQKAIERQQRLEEQQLQREEVEMKVQGEFVQCKTTEEQRKKMATERWKRACHLAALHTKYPCRNICFLMETGISDTRSPRVQGV
jgi:hypothetical protein